MNYYSAIKKSEILPFATKWSQLETITLSEISHSPKAEYHILRQSVCQEHKHELYKETSTLGSKATTQDEPLFLNKSSTLSETYKYTFIV